MKETLKKYIKQKIVVDTSSSWVYIGVLEEILAGCLVLSAVDVHDSGETTTSKERYVLDSKATGIKANRDWVYINLAYVVSFSPLEDVKSF
jgi:hypothetical protein